MSSRSDLQSLVNHVAPYSAPTPIAAAVTAAALALRAAHGPLRFVDPCSGDLRIPRALVAAGWPAAEIHLGDLGAVPSILGRLAAGLDLPSAPRAPSRAHHAAWLIIHHHADTLDDLIGSHRAQAGARDLRESTAHYVDALAPQLTALEESLAGCHFTEIDVREHARAVFADPGAVVWLNPPLKNEPGAGGWDAEEHLRPLWEIALRAASHVLGAAVDDPPVAPFATCSIGNGLFHAWSNRDLPPSVTPTVGSTAPGRHSQIAGIAAPFYRAGAAWSTLLAVPSMGEQAEYYGRLFGWEPPAHRRGFTGCAAILLDGALAAVIGYTPPTPRSRYPDAMTASLALPPAAFNGLLDEARRWAASSATIEAATQSASTPDRAAAMRIAKRVRIGARSEPMEIE